MKPLCDEAKGTQSNETLRSCSLRCQSIYLANNNTQSSSQFVVDTHIHGIKCRVLYDTGASVCFVKSQHQILEHASPCSDANGNLSSGGLQICLGDNSRVTTDACVQLAFSVGGKPHKWDYHVMELPAGIDVIVGMDFMKFHDVVLLTADQRVLFGDTLLNMKTRECQVDLPSLIDHTCRMHEVASQPVDDVNSSAHSSPTANHDAGIQKKVQDRIAELEIEKSQMTISRHLKHVVT